MNADPKSHRRAITAWTMYDWANSAFATTIMAAVLPIYYSTVAAADLPPYIATAYWGYTTSIALLISALLSPILGALADFRGAKKRFLMLFVILGVTGTALLYLVRTGDYWMASVFFILGNIGFSGSLVFYDSLLPHIARPDEIDQVSTRGYAMGYLGGGLLLAANLAMIMLSDPSQTEIMTRLSFVTVAVWWLVFSIPIWRIVPEPPRRVLSEEQGVSAIRVTFRRLVVTFREIRRYRDLFLFLIAFWFYNNGIGTIITMATIYGTEIGIGQTALIGTLLMVQFLGVPFAFAFGWLAKKLGTKQSIYLSLTIYTGIAILGYFLSSEWQFWALGALVATVQGGSQALSRSLIGRMMPVSKSAECYGFFCVSEKLAGIAGP
ncbi:MAG: MFS transporter, partial [Anaerolineaceae bacterium]|nr:MFS transporter [Anaerolineaceae bacterium]